MSRQFRLGRGLYTAKDFGYNSFRMYGNDKTRLELPEDIEKFYDSCDPQDIIELVRESDDGSEECAYLLNGVCTVDTPMTEIELVEYLKDSTEDIEGEDE